MIRWSKKKKIMCRKCNLNKSCFKTQNTYAQLFPLNGNIHAHY